MALSDDDPKLVAIEAARRAAEGQQARALALQLELAREHAEDACKTLLVKAAAHKQRMERAAVAAAAAAEAAAAEAERAAREAAEEEQRRADAATLGPSSELEAKAAALRDDLSHAGDSLTAKKDTLDQKLAEALVRKKANPKDLVLEWDRKHKGEISKVEFRQGVRGLGLKADNKEIDTLFDSIDTDGGGSLDVPEVRAGGRLRVAGGGGNGRATTDATRPEY